jgi:hypothetical protein
MVAQNCVRSFTFCRDTEEGSGDNFVIWSKLPWKIPYSIKFSMFVLCKTQYVAVQIQWRTE